MSAGDPNPNMRINDATGQVYFVSGAMDQGWICPKCGRVYSPVNTFCLRCNYAFDLEEKRQADKRTEDDNA